MVFKICLIINRRKCLVVEPSLNMRVVYSGGGCLFFLCLRLFPLDAFSSSVFVVSDEETLSPGLIVHNFI